MAKSFQNRTIFFPAGVVDICVYAPKSLIHKAASSGTPPVMLDMSTPFHVCGFKGHFFQTPANVKGDLQMAASCSILTKRP